MALTPSQQSSRLFKKSIGAAETKVALDFFEESYLGKTAILPSQIWAEASSIPTTAPAGMVNNEINGVVQRIIKLSLTYIAGSNNCSFYHASLKNTIPYNFGDGSYNYALYQSDGSTPIPFGLYDWLLDTDAGVLTFYNTGQTIVSESNLPRISVYKYVGEIGLPSGVTAGIHTHTAVKAATTAANGNISNYSTLTSGFTSLPASIDGYNTFSEGYRFLIKNQTNGWENGVYQVSGTTLVRAQDSDGQPSGEVAVGDYVFVSSGISNMNYGYALSTTNATDPSQIVVGVDTQYWEVFSASKSYTADELAIKLNNSEFKLQINSGTTNYSGGLYQSVDGLRLTDAVMNDLTGATSSISSMITEITGLTSSVSSLSTEITGLTSTMNAADSSLASQITGLTSGINSLSTAISGITLSDSSLSTAISSLATEVTGLTSIMNAADSSLTSEITGLTSIVSNISNSVTGLTSSINSLETEITGLTSIMLSTDTSLSSAITGVTSMMNAADLSLATVIDNLSGVTAQTAGSGLTYNALSQSLNVNVDGYTMKIVNNELRSSQLWIQTDKTTTISAGLTGATNITLTYDPVTPIQAYVNGIEYLVNPISGSSSADMPFFFLTIPTVGSTLCFDAAIAGFDLVSGFDLIVIKYQYVDTTP